MATTTPVVVQRGPVKVATIKRKVGRNPSRKPLPRRKLLSAIYKRMECGESLRSICRDITMPSMDTVFEWLRADPAETKQYAQAREHLAEYLVGEMLDVSRDATPETAAAVRVQCDAIKWFAGKVKRKVYGDEPATAVTVNNVNVTLDEDTRMKLIEAHQRMQSKFSEKVITLPEQAA